jgi:predicted nuclease with RNAse H fold
MLTAGVDLAAQSRGTALAVIDWRAGGAVLRQLHLGVGDEQIVLASRGVDKLGIDCALGWPDEFVAFVAEHSALLQDGPVVDGGIDWRRTLAYRETDREVHRTTGHWPLSVSTDRLGLTAMRCAGLLGRIARGGIPVDRSGTGVVVEVYPGASLRCWNLPTLAYRTTVEGRETLLRAIRAEAPWLDLGEHGVLMTRSADALDAVIAALAARSAAIGKTFARPAAMQERARREGWIALPSGPIADLVGHL